MFTSFIGRLRIKTIIAIFLNSCITSLLQNIPPFMRPFVATADMERVVTNVTTFAITTTKMEYTAKKQIKKYNFFDIRYLLYLEKKTAAVKKKGREEGRKGKV